MLWRESNYFWLLPLVLLLGIGLQIALRGRVRAFGEFADADLVRRLALGVSMRRRDARVVLRVVVLALLVIALAGPKYGFHWEEVRREGIDLIVAIDTSRSMLATDVKPNRLERAKLAVLDLVPRLRGDRIGLVAYAGTAFLESPLTLDYAAFSRSLRSLQVGIIPRGGTSLSRAIESSLDGFEARQGKYEALILITDGEDHEGDALEAAEKAAERGVKIYTVGIGTPEGELLPLPGGAAAGYVKDRKGQVVKSRLNESLLRDVALDTGGAYVRGLGPQLGLDEVFDQHIAKMERREVDSGLERRFEERFQIPLLLAILLLIAEIALGEAKGARRPSPRRWYARFANRRGWGAALLLASLSGSEAARASWLDRELDPVNRGVQSFESGDYAAALDTFGQALVESPASPLLQFDLAAALYKQGRYEDAIGMLEKVAAEGGDEWSVRANYNLGNAYYRAGAEVEGEDPQQTLEKWAQAMLAYRRAMAGDDSAEDPRYNHELVERRVQELEERLEQERQEQEQQDDQEQQQDDQQQQQDDQEQEQDQEQQQDEQEEQGQGQEQQDQEPRQQEQPGEEEQQQEQQQPDEQGDESEQQQQEAGEEQQEQESQASDDGEQQPEEPSDSESQAGGGTSSDQAEQEAAENAARAVLDTARGEELGPEDVGRRVGVSGIGDALEDW